MKNLTDYAKQSQGHDEWAELKDWKDPGRSKSGRILTGDTPLQDSKTGRFKTVSPGLNKSSDSTA